MSSRFFVHILLFGWLIKLVTSTTPHTIFLNGNTQEFDHETEMVEGSENCVWFITFDDSKLYIGVQAPEVVANDGKDLFTLYFDTDPKPSPKEGTGNVAGLDYAPSKVRLPFSGNVVIEYKFSSQSIYAYKWGKSLNFSFLIFHATLDLH